MPPYDLLEPDGKIVWKNCLQIRQINKDKYWQESGPLIILQSSTLNGENRHSLLITRVTKTINDTVKKGSWRHDCRCSLSFL